MGALVLDDRTTFQAEGYWLQRDAFTPVQTYALRQELDRLAMDGGVVAWSAPWLTVEPQAGFAKVERIPERSEAWRDACERLRQTAETLMPGATLHEAVGIIKPPARGLTFPWHQDGIYYGPVDGRYVIANVYLDDVTPTNGSLRVIPGSHGALVPHSTALGKKAIVGDVPPYVEPHARAGDVCWFHLWTIHGSAPNRSDRARRAVRVGFLGC